MQRDTTYKAHGKTLRVRKKRGTWIIRIEGEPRVRWASYTREVREDIAYFLEYGSLPPTRGTSWA